jgi:hypothetical protein
MNLIHKVLVLSAILGLSASNVRAEGPEDLLIIANKSVAAATADAGEIKAIFLKGKTAIGGDSVFPLNAKSDSDLRGAFRKRVLKMNEDKERGFWEDEKVKKGVEPPPEVPMTLKAVSSKSGGISYVFRKDYKDGVAKILATFAE